MTIGILSVVGLLAVIVASALGIWIIKRLEKKYLDSQHLK